MAEGHFPFLFSFQFLVFRRNDGRRERNRNGENGPISAFVSWLMSASTHSHRLDRNRDATPFDSINEWMQSANLVVRYQVGLARSLHRKPQTKLSKSAQLGKKAKTKRNSHTTRRVKQKEFSRWCCNGENNPVYTIRSVKPSKTRLNQVKLGKTK